MGVGEIDHEGSGSMLLMVKKLSRAVSQITRDKSLPITQNELIIMVLLQQFHQQNTFITMQNVSFCLKDECLS